MVVMVAAVAYRKSSQYRGRQKAALKRSLSCPALVELRSRGAVEACAAAFASFDERRPSARTPGMRRRDPSMPSLEEATDEDLREWSTAMARAGSAQPSPTGSLTGALLASLQGGASSASPPLVPSPPFARSPQLAASPKGLSPASSRSSGGRGGSIGGSSGALSEAGAISVAVPLASLNTKSMPNLPQVPARRPASPRACAPALLAARRPPSAACRSRRPAGLFVLLSRLPGIIRLLRLASRQDPPAEPRGGVGLGRGRGQVGLRRRRHRPQRRRRRRRRRRRPPASPDGAWRPRRGQVGGVSAGTSSVPARRGADFSRGAPRR